MRQSIFTSSSDESELIRSFSCFNSAQVRQAVRYSRRTLIEAQACRVCRCYIYKEEICRSTKISRQCRGCLSLLRFDFVDQLGHPGRHDGRAIGNVRATVGSADDVVAVSAVAHRCWTNTLDNAIRWKPNERRRLHPTTLVHDWRRPLIRRHSCRAWSRNRIR